MSFYQVLTEALNWFMEHGFSSQKDLNEWSEKIKKAAQASMMSDKQMQKEMEKTLGTVYKRLVTHGGLINKDVSKFTVDKLKPKLRAELDRRIAASANLIQFNREEAINNTMRRFQGWATSIPKGGSNAVEKVKQKEEIKKGLSKLPFDVRRVNIDQSHKLAANIKDIVAIDAGAIAGVWHSRHSMGYNNRVTHLERDTKVYAIKNNWAIKKGLMKVGSAGYTDDITSPGEEVFCSCSYKYIYSLNRLAEEMLTVKGKKQLQSSKQD